MNKRIVYTTHSGGVEICIPAPECLRVMSGGGYWNGYPRGFLKRQIEAQIAAGHNPDAVTRFVMAMQFGGCTEAEAYGIIRDRDCGHRGVAFELWDVADIPADRTYRNAWRRSRNGGPIYIDEYKAQQLDEQRAWAAYEALHGAR